jgi:hypothetical protein
LLAEKALHLIQQKRMADLNKALLKSDIEEFAKDPQFNLYSVIEKYI